jgi:acyl-CoA dehydrogenase
MTAPARRSATKPSTSSASLSTDLDGMEDLLDGLVSFVDSVVVPLEAVHADIFRDDRAMYAPSGAMAPLVQDLHRQTRMAAAHAGFYGMCVPTELGGGGQGPLLHYLAWERLYHRYGPGSHLPYSSIAHWARGPSHLFAAASRALQERVLPRLMLGEVSLCFCLSEPDAGSDSWNLRTMAEPTGNGWRLNGTKQWATNGPTADYALVFAVTDAALARQRRGGVTAFVVATDSPGFHVDSVIRLFGSIGGDEAIISLNDVEVSAEDVVGQVGEGFTLALAGISLGRMFNAGRAVGFSRWALERAARYANDRVAFGKPIAEYQAIQRLLANSAIRIYTSQAIALDCAHRLEKGEPLRKELAMVKAHTTEASYQVLDDCMQVFGGMGFTTELHLYRAWHQSRISRVADGSAEIMQRTIANRILHGDWEF